MLFRSRAEILRALGRETEARKFLEQSFRDNPKDPVLLQFVQMMVQQQQAEMARAAGQGGFGNVSDMRGQGEGSSGLWTPDSEAPPSQQSDGGSSKLWIPD